MPWNWQLPDWPHFHFDPDLIAEQEKQFLLMAGSASAFLKKVDANDHQELVIEILSSEGQESARIEGELLDRGSLQSSIQRHFGIKAPSTPHHPKEVGMAALLCDLYHSYDKFLTQEMLYEWHGKLFSGTSASFEIGKYRIHEEPMQIVSHRLNEPHVFFEAPPSEKVAQEMDRYIEWFNGSVGTRSILGRAAIAHLYFENIHPFEDGNGRVGRALIEKCLSQEIGRPILIAVSKTLEKRRKEYYQALETCNRSLNANAWVQFFAGVVLEAQESSFNLLNFVLEKSKWLITLKGSLNPRQEKALLRMFQEGPEGFQGGLSAEKYITITKASRPTATRDLMELVELGVLIKTGELRHTRYWLNIPPVRFKP